MHRFILRWAALCLSALCAFASAPALACTVANENVSLGEVPSFTLNTATVKSTASAGILCTNLLQVLSTSYLALRVTSTEFLLRNAASGKTIPFTLSWEADGPQIPSGTLIEGRSSTLLGLLNTTGGRVILHYKTAPTTALAAGEYTAAVGLIWYHSVCTVGALGVCVPQNSPGIIRAGCVLGLCLGEVTNPGTGRPVTMNITLTVKPDCKITAPEINFDSAPLASEFPIISQQVDIRCSTNSTYRVELDDGSNPAGSTRQMRSGTNFLQYDVYQGTSGTVRWGATTGFRSSASADVHAGQYDSITNQGYRYRAQVRPNQNAPVGTYTDTLRVNVVF